MQNAARIMDAWIESRGAAERLRAMKAQAGATQPAWGHMPFVGHRTQQQIIDRQARAVAKNREAMRRAAEYGYDPQYARPTHD